MCCYFSHLETTLYFSNVRDTFLCSTNICYVWFSHRQATIQRAPTPYAGSVLIFRTLPFHRSERAQIHVSFFVVFFLIEPIFVFERKNSANKLKSWAGYDFWSEKNCMRPGMWFDVITWSSIQNGIVASSRHTISFIWERALCVYVCVSSYI